MIELQDIKAAAQEALGDGDLFLVDVKMSAGYEIEIFIDCDGRGEDGKLRGVTVDDCAKLTKVIENQFDSEREEEDFALTVSSAGIGQPLKVLRQYKKLTGSQLEVVLTSGGKLVGTLETVDENGNITLSYIEKERVEGKKRYEKVAKIATLTPEMVKKSSEYIDFR